jgi:Protein of unknown function (DUF1488)
MPLTATADPGHHHFATDVVYFYMKNGSQRVRCGVSRLALELLEPDLPPTKQGRIQAFKQRRARIERAASAKFDRGHLQPDGRTVLVRVGGPSLARGRLRSSVTKPRRYLHQVLRGFRGAPLTRIPRRSALLYLPQGSMHHVASGVSQTEA